MSRIAFLVLLTLGQTAFAQVREPTPPPREQQPVVMPPPPPVYYGAPLQRETICTQVGVVLRCTTK